MPVLFAFGCEFIFNPTPITQKFSNLSTRIPETFLYSIKISLGHFILICFLFKPNDLINWNKLKPKIIET